MRWMMPLTVVFLLAASVGRAQVASLPGAPAQPQAAAAPSTRATAVLRGHVVAADTGQPLRQALVRMNGLDGGGNRVVTTDADGAYEIKDLQAGRYNVNASKSTYVTLQYGQTQALRGGTPLTVLDDQIVERIDFALQRGGVVRGRIIDEYGEPMPNLQVAAVRSQTINGQRTMAFAQSAVTTDDLGEFRLFALNPGDYYIQATWRKASSAVGSADDAVGYAQTYFPSTTNAADAQRITVGVGTITSDIVIAMAPVTTANISGTATDSHGQPMSGAILLINSSGGMNAVSGSQLRPDGSFRIANVTPGEYTLRAQSRSVTDEAAAMKISVAGGDITDLRLISSKPVSISGRILVDPGQSLEVGTLNVMAVPIGTDAMMGFGSTSPGKVSADLTFAVKSGSGLRRLVIGGLPGGWVIRAVRVRGADVTDGGIEIKANQDVDGVDVELTNRVTTVIGLVTDARGAAAKNYTAVIFPQDQNLWTYPQRYIRMGQPDRDGRFTIAGLPPGDYYAVALDRIDTAAFDLNALDFLNTARTGATTFSLSEAETKPLDLKLSTGS